MKRGFINFLFYLLTSITIFSVGFSSWNLQNKDQGIPEQTLVGEITAEKVNVPIEYYGITLNEDPSAFGFFEYYTSIINATTTYHYTKTSFNLSLNIDRAVFESKLAELSNFDLEIKLYHNYIQSHPNYFKNNFFIVYDKVSVIAKNLGLGIDLSMTENPTGYPTVTIPLNKLYGLIQIDSLSTESIPIEIIYHFNLNGDLLANPSYVFQQTDQIIYKTQTFLALNLQYDLTMVYPA